jgi:LEA14-like dessication related protein
LVGSPSGQPRIVLGDLQLQSESVVTTSVGRNGLSLNLSAVVHNPNGFGATLAGANYSVYADGHYVGDGKTNREYDLAPKSSLAVSFPISVGWESAFETTGSYLLNWGHPTWEVSGTAGIEIGGVTLPVSFEFTVN